MSKKQTAPRSRFDSYVPNEHSQACKPGVQKYEMIAMVNVYKIPLTRIQFLVLW